MDALESLTTISRQGNGAHRDPDKPAAHVSNYLALLPSGPDAVRRLKLHRVRAAVRLATTVGDPSVRRGRDRDQEAKSL